MITPTKFQSLRRIPGAQHPELAALFFVHGAALGIWFVPLSPVLEAHGFGNLRPYAFAASAVAAFISPLIFGAMADRHASAARVLRGLSLATAATISLATTAINLRWPAWLVLALIQLHALSSAPTFSLSSAIILARLADSKRQFGPVRAMATIGWMAGCWLVSALHADTTAVAGYSGALMWLVLAGLTFQLPEQQRLETPPGVTTWHERLGLDALTLLKNPDHRVVFSTVSLCCIPLAAFYPYTPAQLRESGFVRTSAWMSVGQLSEIASMFALGALLLRWRLKWIIAAGLGFGVLRFLFSSLNTKAWLLAGIGLHGACYALVFITAQIYLDQRVDSAWRARAQALMTLMNSGVGNLLGYLGTGWWFVYCSRGGSQNWGLFWGTLAAAVAFVMVEFVIAYRGIGTGFHRREPPGTK